MDSTIQTLNDHFKLSKRAAHKFAEIISFKTLDRQEVFVKKDRQELNEYLIFDGICRSYLHDLEGNDITLSFFTKHNAISPNMTRTRNQVSLLNFQALSPTKLAVFSSQDLLSLMESDTEVYHWANAVLQKEFAEKVNKEISQISLSATERLFAFREKYPQLENQTSHSYIASYLGITNVSLSRIRSSLITGK